MSASERLPPHATSRETMIELAERIASYPDKQMMNRNYKVGELITRRCTDQEREKLKDLTSDDVQNIRWPWYR